MKVLTVVCIVLAVTCFCLAGFFAYMVFFQSRVHRKLTSLKGAPKAKAEVLQKEIDRTRLFSLRNALMLERCAALLEAGDREKAKEMFPFVRPDTILLNRDFYFEVKEELANPKDSPENGQENGAEKESVSTDPEA